MLCFSLRSVFYFTITYDREGKLTAKGVNMNLKEIRKNKITYIQICIYNAIGVSKYDTICNHVYMPC